MNCLMSYEDKIILQPLFSQAKIRTLGSLEAAPGKRQEQNRPNTILLTGGSIMAAKEKAIPYRSRRKLCMRDETYYERGKLKYEGEALNQGPGNDPAGTRSSLNWPGIPRSLQECGRICDDSRCNSVSRPLSD